MTDQTTPEATDEDRRLARDWAESVKSYPDTWTDRLRAAARVILNDVPAPTTTPKENPEMPDQTLDDQVRPIVAAMRAAMRRDEHTYSYGEFLGDMSDYIKALEALLPPRPTLADMTDDARAACQWTQADTPRWGHAVIIRPDVGGGRAALLDGWGHVDYEDHTNVTPRPDLPRMTWPGNIPAPAPIAPEDYPPRDQLTLGGKWADITKLEEALRQKGEAADQAIVLDDEGDAHVWGIIGGGGWMASVPIQQCGPFRLILNEKEADQ